MESGSGGRTRTHDHVITVSAAAYARGRSLRTGRPPGPVIPTGMPGWGGNEAGYDSSLDVVVGWPSALLVDPSEALFRVLGSRATAPASDGAVSWGWREESGCTVGMEYDTDGPPSYAVVAAAY